MSIENRVQVVTGGTSGMGLACAKRLGEYGPVVVGGRSESRLQSALDELEAAGVKAYGKTCDVSDRASVDEMCAYALEIDNGIGIGSVVNAAGVDFDTASIEQIMKINVGGVINVTEEFLPHLEDAVMVHYSSVTGYFYSPSADEKAVWNEPDAEDFLERATAAVTRPASAPADLAEEFAYYASSKRFVMYYTMANAQRFGKKGNRIFSVAPGAFDTPMLRGGDTDMERAKTGTVFGRFGTPEEMADLFVNLMKPGHDYFTGCDVIMDGGKTAITLIPQLK